jgi:hypothetical protein
VKFRSYSIEIWERINVIWIEIWERINVIWIILRKVDVMPKAKEAMVLLYMIVTLY